MDIQFSFRKRLLYSGILILLTFLIAEGITRLFFADIKTGPVIPENIKRFDPMLGWGLKPSSSGISSRTGTRIEYRINSKGLRDSEVSYEKPARIFRIVLLGDSRTFGYGVPIEKHFSMLLEGYFDAVEVINMGVSGFGVDQELLYLRSEGVKYEPDLVIAYVAHYGNHRHMHETRFGSQKPRFLLQDGQLILTNSPVRMNTGPYYAALEKLHFTMQRYSKLYAIFVEKLTIVIELWRSKYRPEPSDEDNIMDEGFRTRLYELGERLVYAMYEESTNHGAKFVLVTHIPELYDASLKQGLFALDVSSALSNAYFPLPDKLQHINESGNGVLAWEIAQFLKENRLIPASHLRF